MLRITRKANGEVVFKISGQPTTENLGELETLIAAETKGRRIVFDCTDLRSVDGEAVKFLEKWEADSIKLKNCGLDIREWFRRERAGKKIWQEWTSGRRRTGRIPRRTPNPSRLSSAEEHSFMAERPAPTIIAQ